MAGMERVGELVRFGTVAVAGLVVDMGIAWTLAEPLGVPLGIAAVAGFTVAAMVNYALHELWTFRTGTRQLSARRMARYLGVLALTLGARLAALAGLVQLFPPEGWTLTMLGVATGLSFAVNYVASRYLVFRASSDAPTM